MKNRTACVLALVFLATPALAQEVTVEVEHDHQADFTKYSTYAWKEGTPIPNPLLDQRVIAAVEYHLAMKGFQQVTSNPDLHVFYHASATEEIVANPEYYKKMFGGRPGGGKGEKTSATMKLAKGMWVLDIWDAKTDELLWRGTAMNIISEKPEKNEKKINKGAEEMFEEFPPKKK